MWKYVTKKQSNDFLLSLFFIDSKNKSEYIREIYAVSNNIPNNYKVFKIKKNNGGYRTICEPSETLKYIQRQILKNVLSERKVSKYAKAYKCGVGLRDNALPHICKDIILKLDIKDFFNSISDTLVYRYCFPIDYYPKNIGVLLTKLVTYYGYIPQGAPTSACISNIIMKEFDESVGKFCGVRNISYTRYSDDMTFSGNFNVSEVIRFVNSQLKSLGLIINKKKIHVIARSRKQSVTGLVVNDKVQVSKKYRDKIRQEVYYIKKFGLDSHLVRIDYRGEREEYLDSLYGRILFVNSIDSSWEFKDYKIYIERLKYRR